MPRSVPHGCPRHCLLAADLVDQVRRRVGTTGPQFLPDVAHSMGEVEDFRLGRAVTDMSFMRVITCFFERVAEGLDTPNWKRT
jgi:hypothetical protein